MRAALRRLGSFTLVGTVAFVVDISVFNILASGLGIGPISSKIVSAVLATGVDRAYPTAHRQLIDYIGSWGPMIHGHAHPEIVDAVVIGTGAGGAPLLSVLAARGLRVVALEAGPHLDPLGHTADETAAVEINWMEERLSGGATPTPRYESAASMVMEVITMICSS